jgi:hypothetical protein
MSHDDAAQLEGKQFPVKAYLPENVQTLLADGLYVSFSQGVFILSFVQAEPPLVVTRQEAEKVTEVRSRCIARLAISPERMAAMVDVLQRQLVRTSEKPEDTPDTDTKGAA